MIHCIGDSHSSVFSGKEEIQPIWPQRSDDKLEYFSSYRIGPATAYQLETKKPIINEILPLVDINNDSILFCFGEVDIRAHLIKQMELQQKTMFEIINECVNRYLNVIMDYKYLGYKIMVWGPIASWTEIKKYTGPSYGTCVERNIFTLYFNISLAKLCKSNSIEFITIFYDMIDELFETYPYYLDDWEECHMHLSQRSLPLIIKKFKEKNLI